MLILLRCVDKKSYLFAYSVHVSDSRAPRLSPCNLPSAVPHSSKHLPRSVPFSIAHTRRKTQTDLSLGDERVLNGERFSVSTVSDVRLTLGVVDYHAGFREKVRNEYRQGRSVTDASAYSARIQLGREVADVLRKNVVQGVKVKQGQASRPAPSVSVSAQDVAGDVWRTLHIPLSEDAARC